MINELIELPEGWEWFPLEFVADAIDPQPSHRTPPEFVQGVPYVGIGDINNDETINLNRARKVSPDVLKEHKERYSLRKGDFIFGKIGTLGKPFKLPEPFDYTLSANVILLQPKRNILSNDWLFYFMKSSFIEGLLLKDSRATSQAAFGIKKIRLIPVPIPPLNEQRRIVAKIEALKARSQRVKEELEAIPALLDQFRQSVLAAAFRGDLTADWREKNIPYEPGIESKKLPSSPKPPIVIGEGEGYLPAGWMWIPLIKVAKLESGHTPRKSVPEYWEGGDVPWISLQDIRAAHGKTIFDTLSMPTMLGIKNSSARLLPEGTVCFSRDISVGFVTIMGRSMATTQHFANWICGAKLFNKYLMYAFIAARSSLIQLGEGTTVRTIYMPALNKMQVLLPPIEEQYEIVCKIEALFKTADRIEQQYKEARANLDQLDRSILAKAFRGELVPQDPNDEPASILLERIRAEREKLDTKKKAKGKTEKKSRKAKPEAAEPEQLSLPGFE